MVSIIVPVYNIERYLPQCMNSLFAQTAPDFEVILVDDGSTDGSAALCDQYAKQDARVQVIHKKNGGLSSARNAGLDAATRLTSVSGWRRLSRAKRDTESAGNCFRKCRF